MQLFTMTSVTRYRLWATLLLVGFLLLPGSAATRFDGLPLTQGETFVAFFAMVALWTTPWHQGYAWRRILFSGLLLLCLTQGIGAIYLPYGWSVCLRREVSVEFLTSPCEPSAQFRRGERSYIYPTINFQHRNFPVYFMNDIHAFNFYKPDQPDRQHLPYTLMAATTFRPRRDSEVLISTTIPATQLSVNGENTLLPTDRPTTLHLAGGSVYDVNISYTIARRDHDQLRVATAALPFYKQPATSNWLAIGFYRTISAASLLVVYVVLIRGLWQLVAANVRGVWLPLGVFSLLALGDAMIDPAPYTFFTIGVLVAAWLFLSQSAKRQHALLPFLLYYLFTASSIFTSTFFPFPIAALGSAGRDTLAHVWQARLTFTAPDWATFIGNEHFYYQPLHQYVFGLLQKVFGESMWGPFTVQAFLMSITVLVTLRFLFLIGGKMAAFIPSLYLLLVGGVEVITQPYISPFDLMRTSYQQSLSVPLFLLAVVVTLQALWQQRVRWRYHLGLGLLYGAALMIRTDYLPALLGLVVYAWYTYRSKKGWQTWASAMAALLIGFLVFPTLLGVKSFLATGEIRILPTSATVNQLSAFYHLYPYAPSEVSGLTVMATVVRWYSGEYVELLKILSENVKTWFIGEIIFRQLLWYGTPLVVLLALVRARGIWRQLILIPTVMMLVLVGINSFWRQHLDSFEMLLHYDYLLVLLITFSALVLLRSPIPPPLPGDKQVAIFAPPVST